MKQRRLKSFFLSILLGFIATGFLASNFDSGIVNAQVSDERTISRYLSLLEKRPSGGTAFDRVYQHYHLSGRIDELIDTLRKPDPDKQIQGARHMLLGLLHVKQNDADSALEQLKLAAKFRPDDLNVHDALANAWIQQADFEAASTVLRDALGQSKNRKLAQQRVLRLVSLYQKLRQPNNSVEVLQQFEKRFPGDPKIQNQLTSAFIAAGKSSEAILEIDKQLTTVSDQAKRMELQLQQANLLFQLNRPEESLAAYHAILEQLEPQSWQAVEIDRSIREILLQFDGSERLEAYLRQQMESDPSSVARRVNFCAFLSRNGRAAEALGVVQDCPEPLQNSPELIRITIDICLITKNVNQAEIGFQQLESQSQLTADDVIRWGMMIHSKRPSEAVAVWRKLLLIGEDPQWEKHGRLAGQFMLVGLFDEALQQYSAAGRISECGRQIFADHASLLFRQGRREEAKSVLKQMLHGTNQTVSNLKLAIKLLTVAEETESAIQFAEQLFSQSPTTEHRLLLARLYLQQDKFDLADEQFRSVLRTSETSSQAGIRQQVIDMLLQTDHVRDKIAALKKVARPMDGEILLMAQLAESQGQIRAALRSIQKVPEASVLHREAQELQATLQKKAGQLQDAVLTYQRLMPKHSRHSNGYREAIQDLQLQMGRTEDAYQTAKQLFESTSRSVASVSRFVKFLRDAQRETEAIAVLDDYLTGQATSAGLMMERSDLLGRQFRTRKAIDWLWKAFDHCDSESQQRDIASRLVAFSMRIGETEKVVSKLRNALRQSTQYSIRHKTLLLADAYRQANKITEAITVLQTHCVSHPQDSTVISELVDLLADSGQSHAAVETQISLCRQQANKENFQRLAELIQRQPDLSGFQSELVQLAAFEEWTQAALAAIDDSLKAGRVEAASLLTESLTEKNHQTSGLMHSRLMACQIQIAILNNQQDQAQKLAHQVLQSPLSVSDLLRLAFEWPTGQTESLKPEFRARAVALQTILNNTSKAGSGNSDVLSQWRIECEQAMKNKHGLMIVAEKAIFLRTSGVLSSEELLSTANAVANLPDDDAHAVALSLLLADAHPSDGKSNRPWAVSVCQLAETLLGDAVQSHSEGLLLRPFEIVHDKIIESGQSEIASAIRRNMLPIALGSLSLNHSDSLIRAWQLAQASRDVSLAKVVIQHWRNPLNSRNPGGRSTQPLSDQLPEHLGRSFALISSLCDVQQRLRLLDDFLAIKGSQNVVFRDSSTEASGEFTMSWTTKSSHRLFENGRHVGSRNVVTLPADSIISSSDITFFTNLMHGLADDERQQFLQKFLASVHNQSNETVTLVSRMTAAHLCCLNGEREQAVMEVIAAAENDPGTGHLRVLVAAYHFENDHSLSALNVLKTVKPTDVSAYRESLWLKLQIGNSIGQAQVASTAVRSLLGMRLTSDERRHLALVMKNRKIDLKFKVPELTRPKFRQKRPLELLVDSMREAIRINQNETATEIANTILLTSDSTQHTTRLAEAAQKSAVAVLQQNGQLETALQIVDQRLQDNAKSVEQLKLKLLILNGMPQKSEDHAVASKAVAMQLAALVPVTAASLIQEGQDLEDQRRFSEAGEQYLAAFRVKPTLLLDNYYRYFKVFRRIDRLPELAELLLDADLKNLRDNYFVVSELIDLLLSQSSSNDVGRQSVSAGFRLLDAAWEAYPGSRDYLLNNIQAKRLWESQKVVRYVCESLIPNSKQQAFARPWLGLDSAPRIIDGKSQPCPLQRVLAYLGKVKVGREFPDQVRGGIRKFPEWLAGPYLEAALVSDSRSADDVFQKLIVQIDDALGGKDAALPPEVAAVNAVRILKGRTRDLDARLAKLLEHSVDDPRLTPAVQLPGSTEYLLAEMQLSSGDSVGAVRTIHKALERNEARVQQGDAEAAWHQIHSVISAVELMKSHGMLLESVALAKRIAPRTLTISRQFQSNDSVDRACLRMWQQARQSLQRATGKDVLVYLRHQQRSVRRGDVADWDLLPNSPDWGQAITWNNSDFLAILRRLGRTDPLEADRLMEVLDEMGEPSSQLSASLCRMALASAVQAPSDFRRTVLQLLNDLESQVAAPHLSRNAILLACCCDVPANPVSAGDVTGGALPSWHGEVLQQALRAGPDDSELNIWKQCIHQSMAMSPEGVLRTSTSKAHRIQAWNRSLDRLLPKLRPSSKNVRSPLRETRRLLIEK